MTDKLNILVTGASGFVGRALIDVLAEEGYPLTALVRDENTSLANNVAHLVIGDIGNLSQQSDEDRQALNEALQKADVLIHLAARVHVMSDTALESHKEYGKVNTQATLTLARLAAEMGVKRFIFLSSIKVNGELTQTGSPFSERDSCMPQDPYGASKWQAEQGLVQVALDTGMELVIIRTPLIYGPGVKGNFASMMRWVGRGLPLPFGAVNNQRSLLALDNLVSFLVCCLSCPNAANEVFLLSDGDDYSTRDLIKKLAIAQGVKARLVPIPVSWMRLAARLLGKLDVAERLFGSLQIDSRKARDLLGWTPAVTMDEQLRKMFGR